MLSSVTVKLRFSGCGQEYKPNKEWLRYYMESNKDKEQTTVIDNGSAMIRTGFAGEDAPRSVLPCITAEHRRNLSDRGGYVSDEALSNRCKLNS